MKEPQRFAIDPRLLEIAARIVELKRFSDALGTQTSKSRSALIRDLDPIELSIVATLVNKELNIVGPSTQPKKKDVNNDLGR